MSKKLTSTIAGASLFLAIVGIFSRGVGLVREAVYAGSFGFDKNFDIFLIGSVIPIVVVGVMFYIAQNYYIPLISRLTEDEENKKTIILNNFLFFVITNFLIALILFFSSDLILKFYIQNLNSEDIKLAKDIFNLHLISIPLAAASSFIISYLYTKLEYRIPAVSQIIFNLLIILIIGFFSGTLGIYSIPIGFVLGQLLQIIFLIFFAKDFLNFKNLGAIKVFKLHLFFNSTIIYIILIETLAQFYFIADRYFYKVIGEGAVAALNYSFMIFQLPIIIFATALATAIFPKFSSKLANESLESLRKNFSDTILINIIIFIPLTFLFFFYGDIIVSLLLERGKFTAANSQMTHEVLKYFSLSLFFYGVYAVLNKLLYGYGKSKAIFFITIGAIIIKLIGNYILVKYMFEEGLALSTSLSYIFFFISTIILIKILLQIKLKDFSFLIKKAIFHLLLVLVCFIFVRLLSLPENNFGRIIEIIIFLTSYYYTLYLLKENSFTYIMDLIFHVKKNMLPFRN